MQILATEWSLYRPDRAQIRVTLSLHSIYRIVAPPASTPPAMTAMAARPGMVNEMVPVAMVPAFSASDDAGAEDALEEAELLPDGREDEETPVSCADEPKPSPQRETIDCAAGSSATVALAATA